MSDKPAINLLESLTAISAHIEETINNIDDWRKSDLTSVDQKCLKEGLKNVTEGIDIALKAEKSLIELDRLIIRYLEDANRLSSVIGKELLDRLMRENSPSLQVPH